MSSFSSITKRCRKKIKDAATEPFVSYMLLCRLSFIANEIEATCLRISSWTEKKRKGEDEYEVDGGFSESYIVNSHRENTELLLFHQRRRSSFETKTRTRRRLLLRGRLLAKPHPCNGRTSHSRCALAADAVSVFHKLRWPPLQVLELLGF